MTRFTALLLRLALGAVLLTGASCASGGSGAALDTVTSTSTYGREFVTAPAADAAPTASTPAEASSSTSVTTAPGRRPTPTTRPTAPPKGNSASSTTTTTAGEFQVPAENLVPGPGPEFSTWTPPSDVPVVVHNSWTPAPGVEMAPPYQAPSLIGPADFLGCTRANDTNLWTVQVRATLTGGRYWRFPSHASGYTGLFSTTHQSMVGTEFDPDGFDGTIDHVTVETGAGSREDVAVSPPLRFHCGP